MVGKKRGKESNDECRLVSHTEQGFVAIKQTRRYKCRSSQNLPIKMMEKEQNGRKNKEGDKKVNKNQHWSRWERSPSYREEHKESTRRLIDDCAKCRIR